MRKFKVLSNSLTGLNGMVFSKDKIINENQIRPGAANILIHRKKIEEIFYSEPIGDRKIKLAIVASVWKRPDVVGMFKKGIKNLIKNCPQFEISLVLSGSIQDEDYSHKGELLKKLTFDSIMSGWIKYIEIPNEPLAAKVNASTYACKNLGVDYVLCLGSDDIMTPELLNEYAIHMRNGVDFIGVTDFYFYDTVSGKSLYWGGYTEAYRKGHTAGAARAISARLMNKWDWMPWENRDSLILDKSMQDKLKVTPHTIHTFSMKEKNLFALDIKSETNMTPFAKWNNSEFIDTKIIKEKFHFIF
jgi:hypothetical protein